MAAAGVTVPIVVGWMLTVFGHTLVITHSTIVAPLRQRFAPASFFGTLLRCPTCTGWWVGLFWSLLGFGAVRLGQGPLGYVESGLANAFSASGLCWLMHNVLGQLGGLRRLGIEREAPAKVVSIVRRPRSRFASFHDRH